MSFANFTTSKGNSAGLASGIPRKTNAFQVESHSKDSIDVTIQNPDSQFYKSGHVFKSSNAKGYTDNDGHLLSEEGPAYDKLAVYYPLDNLTNDQYADESGNNKHATGYHIKPGMPGYKGCSTYFPGPFNSLNFDGVDDYVTTGNISTGTSGLGITNALTVSCWIKSDTETWNDQSMLIFKSQSFILYPNRNSLLIQLFIETDNGSAAASYYPTNITRWKLYTGTYDGSNIKLYENGSLVNTRSHSGNINDNINPIYIGLRPGLNWYFNGQMSDVRIYNTALTAEQIKDIYNYGSILGHEVVHYKMEKTMGTNLIDSSGNGNDGTLVNGPTYAYGPYDASVSLPKEAFVFGEDDATVSVWMYAISSDNKQIILSNNGYQQQFQFGIDKMSHETTYKKLFLKTKNTADNKTGYFLITETDFEPNRWYFLTIVRKDNNGYIYVDGIRCSTFNRSLTNMPKPVLHYKLDETSGSTANDSSGNGYNGTITGATVNQIGYDGTISAYSFDGVDDYVTNGSIVSNGLSTFFGRDAFTISLWINPDSVVGSSITIPISLGGKIVFNYGHSDPNYQKTWDINDGSGNPLKYTSTFVINTWYHLVAVFKKMILGQQMDI